ASRTTANASTWMSSRVAPLARRFLNSGVSAASSSSLREAIRGSISFTARTIPSNSLRVLPSPARRTFCRSGIRKLNCTGGGELTRVRPDLTGPDQSFPVCPLGCLKPGAEAELVEDVADVIADRVLRDEKPVGDLLRGHPVADHRQDLKFPTGQFRRASHGRS